MIVAVSIVIVVQVPRHKIIHMVSVRHRFVPAVRPVHMPRLMRPALVPARALRRVLPAHRQYVLVKVPFVRMMQMPVMQIIHMPFMRNRRVPAARSMDVRMIFVYVMSSHVLNLSFLPAAARSHAPVR